jgi:hypothetical protein
LGFAFDAFDKRHLPTDDTTAPYTTTNFLSVLEFGSKTDMDQVIVVAQRLLGTQQNHTGPGTDILALRYDASENVGGTISVLQTLRSPIVGAPAIGEQEQGFTVRARLHNLSVRLQCLGTNTGLYPPGSAYIGAVPALEIGPAYTHAGSGPGSILQAWAEDSINVGYIRSTPAASLVQKPVLVHAAVSEAVTYKTWQDISVPSTARDLGNMGINTGLEPIVIFVPRAGAGDTVVNYRVEVAQQWCSRHPNNPVVRATQKQHPPTPSNVWNSAISSVKDIGEHLLQSAGHAALDAVSARVRQAIANRPLAIAG